MNEAYFIFTKLGLKITNKDEKILFNLFRECEKKTIYGIEGKTYKSMIMINGYKLIQKQISNPLEEFWHNLKIANYFKNIEDSNPILTWFKKLENPNELIDSLKSFFKEFAKNNTSIYLLIHFGAGDDRENFYPNYLMSFFTEKLPFLQLEVIPLSSIKSGKNITFKKILGENNTPTLPYLESQLTKLVGKKKKERQALGGIYQTSILNSLKELSNLDIVPLNSSFYTSIQVQNHFINFNAYKFIPLEIILNGIPTKEPSFFSTLFAKTNSRYEINVIYVNPDSFMEVSLSKDKALYSIKNRKKRAHLTFKGRPTLFLGFFDLQNEKHLEKIENWWDDRFRFFDSCIWFRYASLSTPDQLENTLVDIEKYQNKGLYDLATSKEFLEFQVRLFNNSYIERIGREGHHSGHVTPFSFHSELKMKINAYEKLESLFRYSWNILIVDDHATNAINKNMSKSDIIKHILGDFKPDIKTENNAKLNFYYANSIKSALEKIKAPDTYYDLVLLDYLFEEDERIEYGHHFIIEIAKIFEEENWSKIWIMPISVYHNALTDRLRDALIPLYHKHLIISEGADPICTPELFKYRLFSFLELQKEELVKSQVNKQTLDEILKIGENEISHNFPIEKWAEDSFSSIVELGVNFKKLCAIKDKSAFANSALENDFFNLKREEDWYHIQNLFYLMAYGNKYQYPQIRKELLYIFKTITNYNPLFERLNQIIADNYQAE